MKFTIQQYQALISAKHRLTNARVQFHFQNRFGYSEKEATEVFKFIQKLPNVGENDMSQFEIIAPQLLKLMEDMDLAWGKFFKVHDFFSSEKKGWHKIFYTENGEKKAVELNYYDSNDVVTLAEMIKRDIEIASIHKQVAELNGKKNGTDEWLKVYEGDMFIANDNFWNVGKSNIYIACSDAFRRLLYTKGKGYVSNGKPNFDDEKLTHYAITLCDNWSRIGNITTDANLLLDTPID